MCGDPVRAEVVAGISHALPHLRSSALPALDTLLELLVLLFELHSLKAGGAHSGHASLRGVRSGSARTLRCSRTTEVHFRSRSLRSVQRRDGGAAERAVTARVRGGRARRSRTRGGGHCGAIHACLGGKVGGNLGKITSKRFHVRRDGRIPAPSKQEGGSAPRPSAQCEGGAASSAPRAKAREEVAWEANISPRCRSVSAIAISTP